MNAINHAATALLINKKWPGVPIIPTFISVQLIEFIWVVLNILHIENTTIGNQVKDVSDIHLSNMPYSHSITASIFITTASWFILSKLNIKRSVATALAVGISSHIILDVLVHVQDIAIIPGLNLPKLGLGLYGIPLFALIFETLYGIFCWWVFRGSGKLLLAIVLLNIATISLYVEDIVGPEVFLSENTLYFPLAILFHIIFGLITVGWLANNDWR
nr:hypothetical protein [uncultured Vibrio sp.]